MLLSIQLQTKSQNIIEQSLNIIFVYLLMFLKTYFQLKPNVFKKISNFVRKVFFYKFQYIQNYTKTNDVKVVIVICIT